MSFFDRLKERATDVLAQADADVLLQGAMAACIEGAAVRYAVDPGAEWKPGQPLKLLFAGYAGSRNTGADVRVEEMIRQVRHLLGDELAELSILTLDPKLTGHYFRTVRQITLPQLFPKFLTETVHQQHGVIACEGSMFKSKFANALSTLMVGALGLAAAENKIAVGYGGEAGAMDPSLEAMVKRYCRDALIIARNANSREVLGRLGIESRAGTDTAWTFTVDTVQGEKLLREAGWDGEQPVLALCPINPFWWPVKPDVLKGAAHWLTGAAEEEHYSSVYFHKYGRDRQALQDGYLQAIADGVNAFCAETPAFVVLVGMEALDRKAAEALQPRLHRDVPLFISDEHDMYALVSLLRSCTWVVSSRYHALVCSMPGDVASGGITMDERIRNLMIDRGTPELALEVDDPELAERLLHLLRTLRDDREQVVAGIRACVAENLVRMGQMGIDLVDHLRERHPELPIDPRFGSGGDPLDHLPPLNPHLQHLLAERNP